MAGPVDAHRLEVIVAEVIQPKLEDHEERLRAVETLKAQLLAYALVGSVIGGFLSQVAFKFLR